MIEVQMAQEDTADAAECLSGFGELRDRAVARINQINLTVHDERVRRLRPFGFAVRSARSTQHNELIAGLLHCTATETAADSTTEVALSRLCVSTD